MKAPLDINVLKEQVDKVQALIETNYYTMQALKPIMKEVNHKLSTNKYIYGGIIGYICYLPATTNDKIKMIKYALETSPQVAYRLVEMQIAPQPNIAKELRSLVDYNVGLEKVYYLCLDELLKHQELVEQYLINTYWLPYRTCKEVKNKYILSFLKNARDLYIDDILNKHQRKKTDIIKIFAGLYSSMDKNNLNKVLAILSKGNANLTDFCKVMDTIDNSKYDENLYASIKAKILLKDLKNS